MSIKSDIELLIVELESMLHDPNNNRLDAGCVIMDISYKLQGIIKSDDSSKK